MQFVQNNFYRTTAEDKPHHDKAFGYLVYCIGTKNTEMIEIDMAYTSCFENIEIYSKTMKKTFTLCSISISLIKYVSVFFCICPWFPRTEQLSNPSTNMSITCMLFETMNDQHKNNNPSTDLNIVQRSYCS